MSRFKPKVAERQATPIRCLLLGFSKDGKTVTALQLAHHLAKASGLPPSAVVVVDAEPIGEGERQTSRVAMITADPCKCQACDGRGAADPSGQSLTLAGHQLIVLPTGMRGPEEYREAMKEAALAGAAILVLDGITPEWETCLKEVDGYGYKEKAQAWLVVGKKHDQFLKAIEEWPGHVLATCRVKDKVEVKKGEKDWGHMPAEPIQRDQILYAFDVVIRMHRGTGVAEARNSLHGKHWERPGRATAEAMLAWAAVRSAALPELLALLATLPEEERLKGTAWLAVPGNDPARLLERLKAKPVEKKPDPTPAPPADAGAPAASSAASVPATDKPAPTHRKPAKPGPKEA